MRLAVWSSVLSLVAGPVFNARDTTRGVAMSHSSATLSHRRSEGPRRRSVVRVTLLIVLAMVAQACGSSDSSDSSPAPVGAQENAVTSANWNLQLLTPDGMALPVWLADDGTQVNGYLIGKDNQLRATVPAEVLASATEIVVEERTPTGVWNDTGLVLRVVDASGTPMLLPVDASGTAEGTFNGGGAFLGPHEFRLRAQAGSADAVVGYSNVVQATGFQTEPAPVVETNADWGLQVVNMDGTPLDQYTDSTGVTLDKLIVFKTVKVTARVPVGLVTPNNLFVAEYQLEAGGPWYGGAPLGEVGNCSDVCEVSGTYTPTQFLTAHDWRLAAIDTSRLDAPVIASSTSIRLFASKEFSIKIWNTTSNDLTIKLPLGYDSNTKAWTYTNLELAVGDSNTVVYQNSTASFSMVLNKQKCFLDCTDYFMDWSWAPTGTGRTACSDNPFYFYSSGAYTIKLSDNVDGQNNGWKTGILSGMAGPGKADTSCTFTTRDRIDEWISNHPLKATLCIIGIVAVVTAGIVAAGAIALEALAAMEAAEALEAAARTEAEIQAAAADAEYQQMAEIYKNLDADIKALEEKEMAEGATRDEAWIKVFDQFGETIQLINDYCGGTNCFI